MGSDSGSMISRPTPAVVPAYRMRVTSLVSGFVVLRMAAAVNSLLTEAGRMGVSGLCSVPQPASPTFCAASLFTAELLAAVVVSLRLVALWVSLRLVALSAALVCAAAVLLAASVVASSVRPARVFLLLGFMCVCSSLVRCFRVFLVVCI